MLHAVEVIAALQLHALDDDLDVTHGNRAIGQQLRNPRTASKAALDLGEQLDHSLAMLTHAVPIFRSDALQLVDHGQTQVVDLAHVDLQPLDSAAILLQ